MQFLEFLTEVMAKRPLRGQKAQKVPVNSKAEAVKHKT